MYFASTCNILALAPHNRRAKKGASQQIKKSWR